MTASPPSRRDVRHRLVDVLSGRRSREEVADWAAEWVMEAEPEVDDEVVWHGLTELAGMDLTVAPDVYLHSVDDLRAWLRRIEEAES
ncbi:MAG TPA: hypothetical protein VNQ77_12885 [Frankiaceae bacterium]|nr:hypothetical protein [Frankiaceae bacterium]